MKVLVTGINGFVGKHLTDLLLSKGCKVYGLDISDNFEGDSIVKYFKIDILNFDKFKDIVAEIKPEMIFHLAGFSSVKKSFEQPDLCKRINVNGTKNLLDAVIKSNIDPKILIISSAEVYGIPSFLPIKETDKLNPISPYGESKKEQEDLCLDYYNRYNLNIIISRSFLHIGPGQLPIFVVSNFAKQIVEIEKGYKSPVINVGNLEVKRDFTDVRDIVEAYYLAIEKCESGETYNICSKKDYSIQWILDKLLSFSKINIKIEQDPSKLRPIDIPRLLGDNSKFKNQTGWKSRLSIEKSLKDILYYWRNNLN